MATLHYFDLKTRRPTGKTEEVDLDPEYIGESAEDIWEILGRELPVEAIIWEPPNSESVFNGYGWCQPDQLTPSVLAGMIATKRMDATLACEFQPADKIIEVLTTSIEFELELEGKALDGEYSKAERESWPLQKAEAIAIINNTPTETNYLKAIAEAESRDLEELAEAVLQKAEEYETKMAAYLAKANTVRRQVQSVLKLKDKVQVINELVELHK